MTWRIAIADKGNQSSFDSSILRELSIPSDAGSCRANGFDRPPTSLFPTRISQWRIPATIEWSSSIETAPLMATTTSESLDIKSPEGVDLDHVGTSTTADTGNHRVLVLDEDGELKTAWETLGRFRIVR